MFLGRRRQYFRLLAAMLICRVQLSLAADASHAHLGLPEVDTPSVSDSQATIALGHTLFFDKRLSADGTISCASCHIPEKAFTDGLPTARGIHGQQGTRNAPSLWNVALATTQFWDGRRSSLEEQALDPLLNPREHGLPSTQALLRTLQADRNYQQDFARAFGESEKSITVSDVVSAIAAYERTLLAGNSPFDRYMYGNQRAALSQSAVRGLELFQGRAGCGACHTIGEHFALFTDNQYHSLGVAFQKIGARLAPVAMQVDRARPGTLDTLIGTNADISALGRFVVTKRVQDIGKFKTPGLRNVALTAPYMHDGSAPTLADAIDLELYYRGIESGHPLILTPREKTDLRAFLESLTSPAALHFSSP